MKRSIIILIALILIVSLPVLASTPTQENAPNATSEDTMFLDMTQLSEEELMAISGNVIKDDGSSPEGAFESEDISDYEYYLRDKARYELYQRILKEAAKKFNISYNLLNSAINAIMNALTAWGLDYVTAGAITAAIATVSTVNPYVAIALTTMGATYLTSLIMHYIQNN